MLVGNPYSLELGVVTTEFEKQYFLVCAASLRPHEGYNPK